MKYLTLLVLPLFMFLTACGGGNTQNKTTQNNNTTSSTSQQSAVTNGVRTIHIYGINQMKYVVKEDGKRIGTAKTIKASNGKSYLLLESIKANPGEKIHIVLTTISDFPPSAMSHDWVLLKQKADPSAYVAAARKASSNNYFPSDKAKLVIAHTPMASGGETVEVTFTVPEQTGKYTYLCAFPAHYAAGMTGKLIVK